MGNQRFILVAMDYFTKWVEAEALANIWKTPYSLTYGAKVVIPAEISLCSARVLGFTLVGNEELMVK